VRAWYKLGALPLLLAACDGGAGMLSVSGAAGASPKPAVLGQAGSAGSLNAPPATPSAQDAAVAPETRDASSATRDTVPSMPLDDADGGRPVQPGADSDAQTAEPTCPDCCPDGFARGASAPGARKLLGLKPSPEGVTVCPNGEVFIAGDDGQIWRVPLGAAVPERWASLAEREPAGLACDELGRLFVAIYSVRSPDGTPGVMRIDGKDQPPLALPGPSEMPLLSAMNGIIAIRGLGVYASDSAAGWVIHLRETQPGKFVSEIVARDILIANGLAYDASAHTLYVASSLGMAVLSFSVAADGSLSGRKQLATQTSSFFDGVAVDAQGTVYAADYSGGTVIRLRDSMVMATIASPASLAFRGGTLLVTDYKLNQPDAEGGLYAIDLGVCGAQL
jgi:hypothetical protein